MCPPPPAHARACACFGRERAAHHGLSLMNCTGQPRPPPYIELPPVFTTSPSMTMGSKKVVAPSMGDGTPGA